MNILTAHCQICGRTIHANTGLMALHGYKRPNRGWQTKSCFGAGYRPYEVSCDAIPRAIERTENTLERTEAQLTSWLETPPRGEHLFRERSLWSARQVDHCG